MKIDQFVMERMQSTWENQVEINLSESGVHPLTLDELVDSEEMRAALFAQPLGYPQTNGTIELRTLISAMYPGATVDHVEVTIGAIAIRPLCAANERKRQEARERAEAVQDNGIDWIA